jgi:hypothetical protein
MEVKKGINDSKYWVVRFGLEIFLIIIAFLFSYTPWGKQLVLCRPLDQGWSARENAAGKV